MSKSFSSPSSSSISNSSSNDSRGGCSNAKQNKANPQSSLEESMDNLQSEKNDPEDF